MVRKIIRGLGLNCVPRRIEGPPQRIGAQVETVVVLFAENDRQHRPRQPVARRLFDCTFKCIARRCMIRRIDPPHVGKAAQHGFIWSQLLCCLVPNGLTHALGQDSLRVADRRDNLGNDVVLQLKHLLRLERTVVALGPKLHAVSGIHQLCRNAQPGA